MPQAIGKARWAARCRRLPSLTAGQTFCRAELRSALPIDRRGAMNRAREIPDFFDSNGFLADPELWDRDMALRIAAQLEIDELEESHWAVIDYLREH